jgi:hypothetical protein
MCVWPSCSAVPPRVHVDDAQRPGELPSSQCTSASAGAGGRWAGRQADRQAPRTILGLLTGDPLGRWHWGREGASARRPLHMHPRRWRNKKDAEPWTGRLVAALQPHQGCRCRCRCECVKQGGPGWAGLCCSIERMLRHGRTGVQDERHGRVSVVVRCKSVTSRGPVAVSNQSWPRRSQYPVPAVKGCMVALGEQVPKPRQRVADSRLAHCLLIFCRADGTNCTNRRRLRHASGNTAGGGGGGGGCCYCHLMSDVWRPAIGDDDFCR